VKEFLLRGGLAADARCRADAHAAR
jgi:hypothetical protein